MSTGILLELYKPECSLTEHSNSNFSIAVVRGTDDNCHMDEITDLSKELAEISRGAMQRRIAQLTTELDTAQQRIKELEQLLYNAASNGL